VDDGSTDDTSGAVEAFARTNTGVVLQKEPHRGKGGAVRAGLLAARADYRFICDADLSMPIAEISRFLPPVLTGFDVAIGSREVPGARRVGEPARRHVAGRVFNALAKRLLLPGIEDTQCGFKMFTARAAQEIFPRVTVDGWAFDIEVLWIARARGFRVAQIPIEWHYRRESRLSMLRDGFGMLEDVLRIRARARRGEYK
jgi:glycosyltransferase involved in cell wall biosynthesis